MSNKKVAHFLLIQKLWNSPPNDVLTRAYNVDGYEVDFFAPDVTKQQRDIQSVSYSIRWLLKHMLSTKWKHYALFSCTSEDPVVIAGVLAFIWRKPLLFLSDEIKSGSYLGDRGKWWKKLCRWAMRYASITIVNDESRIKLQNDYANLSDKNKVIVYPGCFLKPPKADSRQSLHKEWNISKDKVVLGFSGGFNLTAGIDWALGSLTEFPDMVMVAQPLGIGDVTRYLLQNHKHHGSIIMPEKELSWQQSWSSMGGIDIGVAIYHNQAPQFQSMGISSNRLCMFLAMGVPVIVNRQPSFQFIEDYECGVMVDSSQEFNDAVKTITSNLKVMKGNAIKCANEYIATDQRFVDLQQALFTLLN